MFSLQKWDENILVSNHLFPSLLKIMEYGEIILELDFLDNQKMYPRVLKVVKNNWRVVSVLFIIMHPNFFEE